MAQRSIDQEQFGFGGRERAASSLDALASLVDWSPVSAVLDPLYPATKGEPAWPPLAMSKAVLLSIWYDLSDVRLAEVLDDRPSFRCFCGISANEATPERTAFVRFRRLLVAPQKETLQGQEADHETAPSFIFRGEAASGGLQRRRKNRRSAPMVGAAAIERYRKTLGSALSCSGVFRRHTVSSETACKTARD